MRAAEIADLCGGKTKIKGNAIVVSCPCCQPNGPKSKGSGGHLHIEDKADGWAHLSCLLRCPEESILKALGLTQDDRRHENKATPETRRRIEAVTVTSGLPLPQPKWTKYRPDKLAQRDDYTTVAGLYAFSKVRLLNPDNPKDFRCIDIDEENDRWAWTLEHLNGKADVLYNFPRVIEAIAAGETIYINEGEKACNRMTREGLVATCQRAGADPYGAKWLDLHTSMLAGAKEVVIVADLDPASEHDHMNRVGQRYAAAVCAKLKDARLRSRVVTSKTTGDKDDGFDHFEAGYGVADFVARPDLMPASKLVRASAIVSEEAQWLAYPYFPLGMVCGIEGEPGIGKGMITTAIATALSLGTSLPWCEDPFPVGDTLMIAIEDSSTHTIKPRLERFGADCDRVYVYDEPFSLDNDGLQFLDSLIYEAAPKLVIIDPLQSLLDPAVLARKITQREVMAKLKQLAQTHECCILCVRHLKKNSKESSDIDAGYGGIEIIGGYRSALAIRPNPDNPKEKIVRHIKNNVGPLGDQFAYELKAVEDVPREYLLHWITEPKKLSRMAKKSEPVPVTAERFLRSALAEGAMPSATLFSEWDAMGFTNKDALYDVKKSLGIKAKRKGFSDGEYYWFFEGKEDIPYDPATDE